jgi:lipopolysaccharide biosynthesis regulator YciM
MAKITPRRRVALESSEDITTLAQRLLEYVKPYAKWLILAVAVVVVGLGAWGINVRLEASREAKAAAALAQLTPQAAPTIDLQPTPRPEVQALEKFVKEYAGTRAAREAQLLRANLLFGAGQFAEAARAYQSLLDGRDPGWDTLVNESLSYCYEGMGDYKKAAEILKPVAEQVQGPLQTETLRRLALLYEKAKEPKEAAVYWRKLLEKPPSPAMVPYLQERLAATEAAGKK